MEQMTRHFPPDACKAKEYQLYQCHNFRQLHQDNKQSGCCLAASDH